MIRLRWRDRAGRSGSASSAAGKRALVELSNVLIAVAGVLLASASTVVSVVVAKRRGSQRAYAHEVAVTTVGVHKLELTLTDLFGKLHGAAPRP